MKKLNTMKKLLLILLCVPLMFSSCISLHNGFPSSSAALSLPNFTYIKTNASGQSSVLYVFGFGGWENQELVNNAIIDMKNKYPLEDNQAYANMSVNFKKDFILGFWIKIYCNVNADIVEFQKLNSSNNKKKEKILQSLSEENSQSLSEETKIALKKRINQLKELLRSGSINQEEYDDGIKNLEQFKIID